MDRNPGEEARGDSSGVIVRELTGRAEWAGASLLYRRVFGYESAEHGVSPNLLAALADNGGTVIGAFLGEELVGFCYGVSAADDAEFYHYSQAAVVDGSAQGRGIGRLLKHAQADAARRLGARSMRWAFDPYKLRNAHFNLRVLGARGIAFRPDYYKDATSDRVLVRWDLHDEPRRGASRGEVRFPVLPDIAAPRAEDRERLRDELSSRLSGGEMLVEVARVAEGVVAYRFEERA